METHEKLEHNAVLMIDELNGLIPLFEKEIEKIVVDLRGRTTIAKNRNKINELGILRLTHTYLDIRKDNLDILNKTQLLKIIEDYKAHDVRNIYMDRLVVHWKNGDMQEWKGTTIKAMDKEIKRTFPNSRGNVLAIKLNLYEAVIKLQNVYGVELVQPTICKWIQVDRQSKRVCAGTMATS
jgi:hypothetical protein